MNKRNILDAVNTYANLQQVAATEKLKAVAKEQAVVAKEQTAAIKEIKAGQERTLELQRKEQRERERQTYLKQAIFEINRELIDIKIEEDSITQSLLLMKLLGKIQNVGISPELFEEISDKEYCDKVLMEVGAMTDNASVRISKDDWNEVLRISTLANEFLGQQAKLKRLKAEYAHAQEDHKTTKKKMKKQKLQKQEELDEFGGFITGIIIPTLISASLYYFGWTKTSIVFAGIAAIFLIGTIVKAEMVGTTIFTLISVFLYYFDYKVVGIGSGVIAAILGIRAIRRIKKKLSKEPSKKLLEKVEKLSPKQQQLNTDIEDLEQRLSKTEESLKAIVTERPKLAFLI